MRIEKGLKKVPGVLDAQVNLATERGTVTYDPAQTGMEQLLQKVEAVGYKAIPLEQPAQQKTGGDEEAASNEAQADELSKRKASPTDDMLATMRATIRAAAGRGGYG